MKRVVFVIVILFMLGFVYRDTQANGQPLPPLPKLNAINRVINQTSGIPYEPIGVSDYVMRQLRKFDGVFANIEHMVDVNRAIPYFSVQGKLLEQVIPILQKQTTVLDPDMTAPGTDPRPGKIIGVLFQPGHGVRVIVAVFKPDEPYAPPEKVRFYHRSGSYEEYSLYWGLFSSLTKLDKGAVIAHRYSCVTVGIEQVCWDPFDHNIVRDEPLPKDIAYNAYTRFKDVYDLQVDFYVDDAIPDLIGHAQRRRCGTTMAAVVDFSTAITECRANLIFTSAKDMIPGQPLGIFVVRRPANIKTYNRWGNYIGKLPKGEYLVIDATPAITIPGSVGVLYLVNIDTVNHYMIPMMVMEGFAVSAIQEPQAAIKDGFVWGRGFGY